MSQVELHEQDLILFQILLEQQCLTLQQLLSRFAPDELKLPPQKKGAMYHRLYRMVKAGFLKQMPYRGKSKVYLLAEKGWKELDKNLQDHLPCIQDLDMSTIEHDLLCASLRFYLEQHGGSEWNADREFRQVSEKLPRVPDGAIVWGKKDCFIEVELSQKSKARYDEIAQTYTADKGPDYVLYFYRDEKTISYLREQTKHHSRLVFFPLDDEFAPPGDWKGWRKNQLISLLELGENCS